MADYQLSVVIMNWARPANVRKLIKAYANHVRVGEVIVWDASHTHPLTDECGWFDPDAGAEMITPFPQITADAHTLEDVQELTKEMLAKHRNRPAGWNILPYPIEYKVPEEEAESPPLWHSKIRYIRSTTDFGLYARYAIAGLAVNRAVLIVDDDIELPDTTITHLHDGWLRDSSVIHGLFGRNPDRHGNYTPETHHGAVQIVLTRALVVDRYLCGLALAHASRIVEGLAGTPRGNGEDIVLSHVAMQHSGRLNHAYGLPYKNNSYDDANAISVRVKDHVAHRTKVVQWCRDKLLGGQVPGSRAGVI